MNSDEEYEEQIQNEAENDDEQQEIEEQEAEQVEEIEEPNEEETEEQEQEESAEHHEQAAESDDEEFAGFGEDEIKGNKKKVKRRAVLDDNEEGEENEEVEEQEIEDAEQIGEVEHEEEVEQEQEVVQEEQVENEDIEEEEEEEQTQRRRHGGAESDFDLLVKAKKQARKKSNRRGNEDSEALTDADTMIVNLIGEMKAAAAEDRAANEKSLVALRKLKMLPLVVNMLQKSEYHETMIVSGMLGAMAEWLAPLPDRSLSNIKIREELINALQQFGEIELDYLKSSGIGKATMFLFKHPKETKQNKEKLEKLINNWARPIFNLDSSYKQLSKEERQQRDMEHVKSLKRRSSNDNTSTPLDIDNVLSDKPQKSSKKQKSSAKASGDDASKVLRPGEMGFCPRARVPMPSAKDYVVRPKSNVDNLEIQEKKIKKQETRIDKHRKRFVDIRRQSKANRAVSMSIEGRKMPL